MSMISEVCEYWVGMDEWTLIQAPLLFVEVDPSVISQDLMKKLENYFENDVQVEQPNTTELSKEQIQESWRIYQRFRRVEFGLKYSTDPYYNMASSMYRRAYHPYLFMREAIIRNISIPEKLRTAIDDRHLRENKKTFFELDSDNAGVELKQKKGRSHEYDNIKTCTKNVDKLLKN